MTPSRAELWPRLRDYGAFVLKRTGARAYGAIGLLLIGSLLEGASILMLAPILQLSASGGRTVELHPPAMIASLTGPVLQLSLLTALGMLVALIAAQALSSRLKSIFMGEMLYDFINTVRVELFESIGKAQWRHIVRQRGADLNHALTGDIERVQAATYNIFLFVQAVLVLGVYLALAWSVSAPMTMFAVAVGASSLALLQPVRRHASRYGHKLTELRQRQYRTVSDFLGGMKIARSLGAEGRYFDELRGVLSEMRADYLRFVRINLNGGLVFQLTAAAGVAAFVYMAIARFGLATGQIIVLVLLFMRVAPRFQALQGHVQELLANLPAFEAIQKIQAQCDRLAEPSVAASDGRAAPRLEREIRLQGVGFAYEAQSVLKDVSLTIRAGAVTALIGPSGSGKSTVADLVLGLLEPDQGLVTVDGEPLTGAARLSWRASVAYVPQEVFLLHDTIATNLRLAAPTASDEDLWRALSAAQARSFVERLPEGLETILGDRGQTVSGGERQRLALARALLREPQLLILDEATSALDWENQAAIASALQGLAGKLTILTIAHRPSMIAFADWVVAMEQGQVVENAAYTHLAHLPDSRLSRLLAGEGSAQEGGPASLARAKPG